MNNLLMNNGLTIPSLMLGSFNIHDPVTIREMVSSALSCGIIGFDTSPSYGSEGILGQALKDLSIERTNIFITDKIDGIQMFESKGSIERYVDESLNKLQTEYLDLLLIHWPFEKYIYNTWKHMIAIREQGMVRSIGLCNIGKRKLEQLDKILEIAIPNVIQIEISPLRTAIQDVEFFQNKGIIVEAYSPMCRMIPEIRNNQILQEIANKHGRTISQIILRWHLDRNIIPVFTSTKSQRIKENSDIFDFYLDEKEILMINHLNQDYKLFPESFGCPGY